MHIHAYKHMDRVNTICLFTIFRMVGHDDASLLFVAGHKKKKKKILLFSLLVTTGPGCSKRR